MYLAKTRAVPFSEEKTDQKKPKQYYRPPRYSRKKKTPAEQSVHVRNEELI